MRDNFKSISNQIYCEQSDGILFGFQLVLVVKQQEIIFIKATIWIQWNGDYERKNENETKGIEREKRIKEINNGKIFLWNFILFICVCISILICVLFINIFSLSSSYHVICTLTFAIALIHYGFCISCNCSFEIGFFLLFVFVLSFVSMIWMQICFIYTHS